LLALPLSPIKQGLSLDDPFPDPDNFVIPPASPTQPPDTSLDVVRIGEDEDPLAELPEEEAERQRREAAAKASALTLEMVGDLPFANVRPPENVLFVCKLNAVTRDEDLELIFSRFGTIMSCQVIRDKRTGDSLQYAFIEFDKREDAEQVDTDVCSFHLGSPDSDRHRRISKCRTFLWMIGVYGWICMPIILSSYT
jgi:peptidyl-prolyl cis-trans isomerase-like 4